MCLHGKPSRAHPLGILGRELTIELCWLVEGGDGMEIGRVGVWRRYCAGDGVSEGDLLPQGVHTHEKNEENIMIVRNRRGRGRCGRPEGEEQAGN